MKRIYVLFLLFFALPSIADVVDNFTNMCGNIAYYNLATSFAPIEYVCDSGTFLPADTLGCTACPYGATCGGGTYAFDETIAQGILYQEPITQNQNKLCSVNFVTMKATFAPKEYNCNPGYYLPADAITCVQCPSNSACSGGTYSFNETTAQGIVACDAGTYSPTGSAVCYQHILHVGDNNIYLRDNKLTVPSLNIQIGNDIFYANMTTVPTYMNKDSSHYLHIQYEGDDYYVCDDTTYQE